MLYVTTRVRGDAFTAMHALTENRGPEGGFFVPLRLPHLDARQIAELEKKPFTHTVAEILNRFFGTQIDGHEMELGIGRYPVKLIGLNGKITVAKTWHNPVKITGHKRRSSLLSCMCADLWQLRINKKDTPSGVFFAVYAKARKPVCRGPGGRCFRSGIA